MSDLDLGKRIELVHYMASTADSLITDLFHKSLQSDEKLADSHVNEMGVSIESMCLKNIQASFPEDGVSGEDMPDVPSKNSYNWIVDPIDGTDNFVRGLPLCGFQLAITFENEVVYAVILRPFTQEWFTAKKGEGAFYKNRQTGEDSILSVSERPLSEAMAIFDSAVGRSDNPSTQILGSMADQISAVRSFGAAVFDIGSVVSGEAEMYITGIANKYYVAAGTLLLSEAGGEVYDLEGNKPSLDDKFMIFSSKSIKEPLLKAIRSAL